MLIGALSLVIVVWLGTSMNCSRRSVRTGRSMNGRRNTSPGPLTRLGPVRPKRKMTSRAYSFTIRTDCTARMTSTTRMMRMGSTMKSISPLPARRVVAGRRPDTRVVHLADLLVDYLAPVLRVLVGRAVEVEILRIDWLFVEELVQLRAQVLHPVVPESARAVVA